MLACSSGSSCADAAVARLIRRCRYSLRMAEVEASQRPMMPAATATAATPHTNAASSHALRTSAAAGVGSGKLALTDSIIHATGPRIRRASTGMGHLDGIGRAGRFLRTFERPVLLGVLGSACFWGTSGIISDRRAARAASHRGRGDFGRRAAVARGRRYGARSCREFWPR